VLALIVLTLELVGGLAVRRWHDRIQFVEELRLAAALQTFRPSERAGLSKPVVAVDLAADRSVRARPARCAPLTLLATRPSIGGGSWTGINGSPAQPVAMLTIRYADASAARADLADKRVALLQCHNVQLTFPPFDKPAQNFTIIERNWIRSAVGGRVAYALAGGGKRYDFYVRQYANTLTWTYGDDVSTPHVRQQVVDDLVGRLKEMARE
jgi:hypothetical protein